MADRALDLLAELAKSAGTAGPLPEPKTSCFLVELLAVKGRPEASYWEEIRTFLDSMQLSAVVVPKGAVLVRGCYVS